ncbi:hypothetical protein HYS92_03140 [Candidatus Daviesbacteria bacterium]|nr:hypothetical protein [Candidatus Daviesbacteria bacterium]
MLKINNSGEIELTFTPNTLGKIIGFFEKKALLIITLVLIGVAVLSFIYFYSNGLGLAYNDARSHLNIGRRVVEGLKPGFAQIGSVWLPLPHVLMIPTIWNDFMWHSGLSGALVSMISFVATGLLIYKFLERLGVGLLGRFIGVAVFVANINVLYLQSTAMTELLLLFTMTASTYDLMVWSKTNRIVNLVRSAFWVMLSTLVRYDGWFLLFITALLIFININIAEKVSVKNLLKNFRKSEGMILLFFTLAGFGVFLWLLWNLLIFKDPFFFAYGQYSAYAQQGQLEDAGKLITKGDWLLSLKFYVYALAYNSGTFSAVLGIFGLIAIWLDKKIITLVKVAVFALIAPFLFNILALYLGHSVLFIQGLSGDVWFNVRYGLMMMPSIAIFVGFLVDRLKSFRVVLIGLLLFVTFFQFQSADTVTIDDARVGSSQKNVSEVSGWLSENAKEKDGFILISAASHDAIIFSSGLPMKKFIHEGTGKYWESATTNPERWARWIIMRSYDDNDQTWKTVSKTPDIKSYNLVEKYPFADIYELKSEFLPNLNTKPVLGKQK